MPHPSYRPKRPYSPGDWRDDSHTARSGGAAHARRRRQERRTRRLLSGLLVLAVAGVLFAGIAFAALLAWASRDLPDPTRLMTRTVPQSTTIYDRTGKHVLFELHGDEKRTWRSLDQISDVAKWATVAIEDRAFYAHRGFRPTSLVRAALANLRGGGKVQGASTITQQLVKNAILTPEKTYRRKLRELLIAYQLEQRFTKDEILTLYLNEIPFGSNAYGIESAAQAFFGKSARDLDLAESALLAALPQAPTRLSPHGSHTDELKERTHFILNRMATFGYITPEDAHAAQAVDILARVQPQRIPITAPHFVMWVRELLTEQYGERTVEQGGLRVITTLDVDLQQQAEHAIAARAPQNAERYGATNAALVAAHPANGHILALVGSRDFFNEDIDGQVNVAIRPRQPGSSFKPIVYATAFAEGYTPDTLVADVATTFPSSVGNYEPKNYDGKERGFITLRSALAGSLNIPAVKLLELVGIDDAVSAAERLGYTTLADRSRFGLSLVLGGAEVKLVEHVTAYGAFAADGIAHAPVTILRVEDATGAVRDVWEPDAGTRVFTEQPVRLLTSILTDNAARAFVFGERSPLAFSDRHVAAKTGTTNDYRDAWTVGYTPSLAWGVWVGNSDNTPMRGRADGSVVAAPIWRAFADAALAKLPKEEFPQPEPIVVEKPILRGERPAVVEVAIDRTTGLRATDATPPEFVEVRRYQDLHDILHYVRRDDPRGPPPDHPAADPMYTYWEAGLRTFMTRQGITVGAPPATFDAVHTEVNRPQMALTEPHPSAVVDGRNIVVAGTVTAPRTVTQMRVTVDDIAAALFAPETNGSFQHTVRLPATVGSGSHELRVTATDDVGNVRTITITLDVRSAAEPVTVAWAAPSPGATLTRQHFPITLELRPSTTVGVTRLEILLDNDVLTSVIPSADDTVRILWPAAPAAGTHTLRARLFAGDRLLAESDVLTIIVE